MADYIEREALMKYPIRIDHYDKEHGNKHFVLGIESVIEYAKNLPAADVVPKAAYDQVTWERDLAVKQLHEDYGVGLGGKKADAVKVVRCKNCRYYQTAKSNKKGFLICPASGMEITETDYCSYGVRMDKEDENETD